MSVNLEIYSNHNLNFENYFDGINLIEKRLNNRIQNPIINQNIETHIEDEILYFANHTFFSEKFKENKEIYLFTSYFLCESIKVYSSFIQYNVSGTINSKFHLWEKFVSKTEYDQSEKEAKIMPDNLFNDWNRIRSYIKQFAKSMGGDTLIYINDGSVYTDAIELIMDGSDFNTVSNNLNLISMPFLYNDLADKKKTAFDSKDWYVEKF
jgi:predicted transcriptional regulator